MGNEIEVCKKWALEKNAGVRGVAGGVVQEFIGSNPAVPAIPLRGDAAELQGEVTLKTLAPVMASRPASTTNFLILGGCGFLGRNFVKYLLDNALAASIRVADKRHPIQCALSPDHKAALLNKDLVELVQVDLAEDDGIDRAFAPPRAGGSWDFVVNLAAETAHGKPAEFYEKGVAAAGKAAAAAAAPDAGVRKFIQLSSAFVYKPEASSGGTGEDGRVEPWTEPARACARAEDAARGVAGLPLVILRPATVYGPGDIAGLMPRAVVAATYKAEGSKMEMLWDGTLKVSTVHVFDVVRAIYFAAKKAAAGSGAWEIVFQGATICVTQWRCAHIHCF